MVATDSSLLLSAFQHVCHQWSAPQGQRSVCSGEKSFVFPPYVGGMWGSVRKGNVALATQTFSGAGLVLSVIPVSHDFVNITSYVLINV